MAKHAAPRTMQPPRRMRNRMPEATPAATVATHSRWMRNAHIAFVLLVIVGFALIRFRLRDMPLERDEGEYAYAGQLLLHGIAPYKLAYTMKLPGTFLAYAAMLAIFGQTSAGVHLGLILVNATTTLLVCLLARKLFGQLAGSVAAASYAVLSASPTVLGLAGHATHFVLLPALAGILLLLKACDSRRTWLFLGSGALFGLAFLMKQPGIFFAGFGGLYLLFRESRTRPLNWPAIAARAGAYLVGLTLPFGLLCLDLAATGSFSKFWFWTFTYAREYGSITGLAEAAAKFQQNFPAIVGPAFWIWVLAGAGVIALLWNRTARVHAIFLLAFTAFSFAAVCPGFYFREHYFILLLPAVALLAGVAVSSATTGLQAWLHSRVAGVIPAVLFLFAFGFVIVQQEAFFFEADPIAACRELYSPNPFPEAVAIADYIRQHSSPQARIAVFGSEPEIYFYSGRGAATGYIYTYGLTEKQKYALTMQHEMAGEIEAARPEYFVYVQIMGSWLAGPDSPHWIFSWADRYLKENYELAGIADMSSPQTRYLWGEAASNYSQQSSYAVLVYHRKG